MITDRRQVSQALHYIESSTSPWTLDPENKVTANYGPARPRADSAVSRLPTDMGMDIQRPLAETCPLER